MTYPYLPKGEYNHDKQKLSVINHAVNILKQYEVDTDIKKAIQILEKISSRSS